MRCRLRWHGTGAPAQRLSLQTQLPFESGLLNASSFVTRRTRQPWNIRYPKLATITTAQQNYVGG